MNKFKIILSKFFVKLTSHFLKSSIMSQQKVKGVEGPCCKEASAILNLSQGNSSYTQALNSTHLVGHPRFHVLCSKNYNKAEIINNLNSLGCTEVVTDQQGNTKTAFLTREDQNRTLHEILTSSYGRRALELLNQGRNEVILKIATNELTVNRNLMMAVVRVGKQLETKPANALVLLLGHHQHKPEGMYVHVKTFYPTEQRVDGYVLDVTRY
ncbi:hypothetical protein ACKWTF_005916 [Chironomus riparius]